MDEPRLTPADYGRAPVLGHVDVVDVALDMLLLSLGEPLASRCLLQKRSPWRDTHKADVVIGLARALRYVLDDYRQTIIEQIDDDIPF